VSGWSGGDDPFSWADRADERAAVRSFTGIGSSATGDRADRPGAESAAQREACVRAVMSRRGDLLRDHPEVIIALEPGPLRDASEAVASLTEGDIDSAVRSAARSLATAEGDVRVVAFAAAVDVILGCVAVGRWAQGRLLAVNAEDPGLDPAIDRVLPALTFDLQGLHALCEFQLRRGEHRVDELSSLLSDLDDRRALSAEHALALICLGGIEHSRHALPSARHYLQRGVALVPRRRSALRAHAQVELAFVLMRMGDYGYSASLLGQLQSEFDATDSDWLVPQTTAARALRSLLDGDLTLSRSQLDDAEALGGRSSTSWAEVLIVHVRILTAIVEERWSELAAGVDDARRPRHRSVYTDAEIAALRNLADWKLGRLEAVARRIEREEGGEDPYSLMFHAMLVSRSGMRPRISAGKWESSEKSVVTLVDRAVAHLDRTSDPIGRALVVHAAGEMLHAHGAPPMRERALELIEDATAELARRGAVGLARLASSRTARRVEEPWRELTASQRSVLALVVDGYTSAEVAGLLNLSRKTVDFHVANILTRLGLSSRRELRGLGRVPSTARDQVSRGADATNRRV
jgi:DNA-binding CsgD family transcriptional regulator